MAKNLRLLNKQRELDNEQDEADHNFGYETP